MINAELFYTTFDLMSNCLFSKKRKRKKGGKKRKEIHTRKDVVEKKVQACLLQMLCLNEKIESGAALKRPEAPTELNTVTFVF